MAKKMTMTKQKALKAYIETGTITGACSHAEITRATWMDWVKTDAAFNEAVLEAQESIADNLEAAALKRAHEGSDALMVFLLKGLRRNKYVNYVEVDHAVAVQRTQDMAPLKEIMERYSQTISLDSSEEPKEQSGKVPESKKIGPPPLPKPRQAAR
jgi:hypothetical protein